MSKLLPKLVKLRNQTGSEYFTALSSFEEKKAKLFQAKNFKEWGINPEKYCIDKKTLFNNKLIACHLMLPI
jgi:hypothetical protein